MKRQLSADFDLKLHICPHCKDWLASGLDAKGFPKLCKPGCTQKKRQTAKRSRKTSRRRP